VSCFVPRVERWVRIFTPSTSELCPCQSLTQASLAAKPMASRSAAVRVSPPDSPCTLVTTALHDEQGEKVSLEQFAAASEAHTHTAGATVIPDSSAQVTAGRNGPGAGAAAKPGAFSWLSSAPAATTPAAPEAKPESRSSWFGSSGAAKKDAIQVAKSEPQASSSNTFSWFSSSAGPVNSSASGTAAVKAQPVPLRKDKMLGSGPPPAFFELGSPVEQTAKWGITLAILSGEVLTAI
jgi:hypothetical protein